MAHEKVANSAEDVLSMTYMRFLEWNAQLEVRAEELEKKAKKRGNI